MFYIIRLTLLNTFRHLARSFLTVTGIALSVAVILAVSINNTALRNSAAETLAELGTGKTGVWIEESTENTASIGTRQEGFSARIAERIKQYPGVDSVHPMVKVYSTADGNGETRDFYLYGIDFASDRVVRSHHIVTGIYPGSSDEAMIGEKLAGELTAGAGSMLTLPSPGGSLRLRVSGILSSYKGTGTLNNNRIIFADIKVVQKYFRYEDKITSLNIVLKQGIKAWEIKDKISQLLPASVDAYTDPIMAAAGSDNTEMLATSSFLFGLVTIFISAFIIFNTLSSSVEQSRRELGLFRLIGMTKTQVSFYFIFESLIYGIAGALAGVLLGILAGFGLIYIVNNLIYRFHSVFFDWPSISEILFASGIGIITTILTGILPALKASGTSPLNIFRITDSVEKTSRHPVKTVTGILLFTMGLLTSFLPVNPKIYLYLRFVGPLFLFTGLCLLLDIILPALLKPLNYIFSKVFGLPGLLAVQSLHLRLKRTIVTTGSVAVAMGIIIGFTGMINSTRKTITDWYETTRWADVLIFSVSGAEIGSSIIDEIKDYSFVADYNPMRYRFVSYEHPELADNGFIFQGVDPAKFRKFTGIEVKEQNAGEPAILVNRKLGNTLGLKSGDYLKLNTDLGDVDFRINGLVTDYSDFMHRLGKVVYGTYEDLKKYYEVSGYTIIQIRLAQGYTQENAKKLLLDNLTNRYNIKVITHDEERIEVGASVDRIFTMYYALLTIILMIIFLSIFNTILINVLFQLNEFAVLRIVGCFLKQIRTIIICEALAIVITGSLIAVATGFWLSAHLTKAATGILGAVIQSYIPYAPAFVFISAAVFISIIAVAYPQKIATGISISKVMQNADRI
ncbi:MAG: ABC transporter permease [Desulfobacterales bacterium]|nr:ABC transporter permease [Desulfobacterales bacterium]